MAKKTSEQIREQELVTVSDIMVLFGIGYVSAQGFYNKIVKHVEDRGKICIPRHVPLHLVYSLLGLKNPKNI